MENNYGLNYYVKSRLKRQGNMNVKKIIIAKLRELGADGLCCEDCGCPIDDLFLCESCCEDCVPAKKRLNVYDEPTNIFVPLEIKLNKANERVIIKSIDGKKAEIICKIEDRNMKFRKKQVTVDAILIAIGYKNVPEIIEFVGEENICPIERRMDYTLKIKTAEGIMNALPGYWIIKAPDPKGGYRCWPVDPEYFAENYEKVEDDG